MSCRAEDGGLLVEVTRPVSGGVEENGCSGNGSDDGEFVVAAITSNVICVRRVSERY